MKSTNRRPRRREPSAVLAEQAQTCAGQRSIVGKPAPASRNGGEPHPASPEASRDENAASTRQPVRDAARFAWPLADNRELRIERWAGLVVVTVHDLADNGRCTTGPLAVRECEVDSLAMHLALVGSVVA